MQHMNFEEKNEIPLSKLVRISPEIIILDDEDDEIIEEIGKFIPSEIRNELNEGVQKDNFDQSQVIYEKKKLDPNTKIIFADFESVELLEAKAFCENFGLQYIEENISNLSDFEFVVCPFNQLPKGYTLAFAMLQGKTILRKEWIEDSLINNEPQDIESYKIIYNNLILKGELLIRKKIKICRVIL